MPTHTVRPMHTVRLGVVGLGMVARLVYLPLLARNVHLFRVTAVCDALSTRTEEVADEFRVPNRFTDADRLFDSGEVDAVLLLTSGSHAPTAAAAQRAGLPVLCEKPLAYTLAETDELREAPPLQLGYMKLYDPAVTEARRRLPELGELRSVEVLVLHPSAERQLRHLRLPPPTPQEETRVRHDRTLAAQALGTAAAERFSGLYTNVALGSIVHELSVIRAFAGPLTHVSFADVWPEAADPPSVSVLGSTDQDVRVAIRWHYLADHPAYFEEIRVHGERGSLTLRFPTPYVLHAQTELTVSIARDEGEEITRFAAFDEAFERQLQAFSDVCTNGSAPLAGVAEGRADIRTCQQIIGRIAERRGVAVEGETER